MDHKETLEDRVTKEINCLLAGGHDETAELLQELYTRYKTECITANNYKKALEALDHASKQ